jgi:hypothetical protein
MKSSFLALFVVVFFLTGCGSSHSSKTQVDEGQLDQVLQGTWISIGCENQKRRVYNFTKTADGEDVLIVWFFIYKDSNCTVQDRSDGKVNETVMKYKVVNNNSTFAEGKLFTYSKDFESEDSIYIHEGKLWVGGRVYGRALVQVELVDVLQDIPPDGP